MALTPKNEVFFSDTQKQKALMQTWLLFSRYLNKSLANDFIRWMKTVFEF